MKSLLFVFCFPSRLCFHYTHNRWGHTTTLLYDSLLVVFGGHDGEKMLDDIYILDTGKCFFKNCIIFNKLSDCEYYHDRYDAMATCRNNTKSRTSSATSWSFNYSSRQCSRCIWYLELSIVFFLFFFSKVIIPLIIRWW